MTHLETSISPNLIKTQNRCGLSIILFLREATQLCGIKKKNSQNLKQLIKQSNSDSACYKMGSQSRKAAFLDSYNEKTLPSRGGDSYFLLKINLNLLN